MRATSHGEWPEARKTAPSIAAYFDAVRDLIGRLEADQAEAIEAAAGMVTETVLRQGGVYVFDTGHMLSQEMVFRAGGLALLRPLRIRVDVDGSAPFRPPLDREAARAREVEAALLQARALLAQADLRQGDLLFIGSVSGRQPLPVELALLARARGIRTVAITSRAYTARVAPRHPSGKRLMDVVDLVLDNGAPYGDAMLHLDGLETPVAPASGIGAAAVMWAVVVASIRALLSRGIRPHVLPSVNMEGGETAVRDAMGGYERQGF